MNSPRRWYTVLLGAVWAFSPLHAQTSAGRITGLILDASGAIVPNCRVAARNVETGIETATASNAEGSYALYPLPPGTYAITAEAPGFRSERMEDVAVEVGAVLTQDFHLQVAASKQDVVVSAASAPLVTESPSVESTVVREQIETLPLNGRDFNNLVFLSAGAVENAYPGGDFGSVAVGGNRAYGNDYLLDGTPNVNPFVKTAAAGVSVDVIREFKVTSGVAAAEYGQAGTQITLVTRSGTNTLHGSAFEYHRGTIWQAENPFNPGAPQPFDRNQFGGSLGGPVVRNRTFWFFNYEGNRQDQSKPVVASTPPDGFWQGDFSALGARNISLRDPLANRAPFPGNVLPAARIDPIAIKLRPYWIAPTSPGTSNNMVRNRGYANTADQFTVRLDEALQRSQNLSLRFTQTSGDNFTPSVTGNASGNRTSNKTDNASLGWTAPLNATTVNELHLGFADYHVQGIYQPNGLPSARAVGMQGFDATSPNVMPTPQIIFAGSDAFTRLNYGSAAASSAVNQGSRMWSFSEALTMVRGSHTIKAGIELRNNILPALLQPSAAGSITFTGNNAASSTGYSFADFLLGIPANALQAPLMASTTLYLLDFSSYVQDDWRISRRLTLSFGVRHEFSRNPYEDRNRYAMFDPATGAIVVASDNGALPTGDFSPIVVSKLSDGKGNWSFPLLSDRQAGFPARTLLENHVKNVAPRFGWAYNLGGSRQFLLRGGYGLFYNRYPIQNLEQITSINPPFTGNFTYTQSIGAGKPAITLAVPYAGAGAAGVSPGGLVKDWQMPTNQQWNLTLERDMGWDTVASLAYIGNKGTHLFSAYNANEPRLDPVTGASVRPYQQWYGTAAISMRTTSATSIYNAMQMVVRRRFQHGLIAEFNWTWAKGLDSVTNALNVSALDVENLGRDRADSDYVRRHTVHANGSWDLPFGRGRALLGQAPRWLETIAGNWRLAGIWTYYSGRRFTPTINNTGLTNDRPSLVPGVQANLPSGQRSTSQWFNPAAFFAPPATCGPKGTGACMGNAGRNILVGPGIAVLDTSLQKSIPVFGERRRLTFRLELFNALNHPNYGLPDPNISNVNTVGSITNLVKDMRETQFALRYDF